MDIYDLLEKLEVSYAKHEHPAVYTCEEAEVHCAHIPGGKSKNLFLRNRKGNQHYLLVVEASKRADLKEIGALIDEKLGFASPERMMKWIGCQPGSASLLALVNDTEKHVKVMIDKDVWSNEILQYHPPNDNAATIEISRDSLEKFLTHLGYEIKLIEV